MHSLLTSLVQLVEHFREQLYLLFNCADIIQCVKHNKPQNLVNIME